MKKTASLSALVLTLSLAACAAPGTIGPQASQTAIAREAALQNELVIMRDIQDQSRLYNISSRILMANADFCGNNVKPYFGIVMWNLGALPPAVRPAAQNAYALTDALAVQMTADNSPAASAGLKGGDIILAINGQTIQPGKAGLQQAHQSLQAAGYNSSDIVLSRAGKEGRVKITPVRACAYPAVLDSKSTELNAYADGEKIVVTRGMMRFADNDSELALVVAHELAHNALSHIGKKQQNVALGTIGGLAIDALLGTGGTQFSQMGSQMGAGAHSVGFEQEADYVGMYFMQRAGYDTSGVANFWRRMAIEGNSSINMRTTHPSSPERFLAIEATHAEINDKRSKNMPLVPSANTR